MHVGRTSEGRTREGQTLHGIGVVVSVLRTLDFPLQHDDGTIQSAGTNT
jgi:hypothetical protein